MDCLVYQHGSLHLPPQPTLSLTGAAWCVPCAPGQAYKGKGEEYRLFWSERPEFVRMAARYGATIVPFAGVGAEDGFQMLLEPEEIRRLPVVGAMLEERARRQVPQARRCTACAAVLSFIVPLIEQEDASAAP